MFKSNICCRLVIIGTFLIVSTSTSAQFVPMPSTMNTPYGKVNTTNYIYMPMHYNSNYGAVSYKYDFTVVLTNDSILEGAAKININDSVSSITFKKNKEKIKLKPSDTKQLYRITSEGDKLIGIPSDTCWLFKTESGKVNLYSYLAEPYTEFVIAMQLGNDGTIVPIRKEAVLEIVKDYPDLVKIAEKGKLIKAIRKMNAK